MSTYNQYLGSKRCCDLRGKGPQGPQGVPGSSSVGPIGYQGSTGAIGPQGATGRSCRGATGAQGPQGESAIIPTLSQVLASGNSAGIYDIDLSNNDIVHVGNIFGVPSTDGDPFSITTYDTGGASFSNNGQSDANIEFNINGGNLNVIADSLRTITDGSVGKFVVSNYGLTGNTTITPYKITVDTIQLGIDTTIPTYSLGYLTLDADNLSKKGFRFSINSNNMIGLNVSNSLVNGVYKVNISNSGTSRTISSALNNTTGNANRTSYSTATIANGETWVMTIQVVNFSGTIYNCVSLEKFV